MADAAREVDDVKSSDRPFGGTKGNYIYNNNGSSNQPQSSGGGAIPDHAPPQTANDLTVSKEEIDKYKIYGYNKCNMKLGVGDAEAKRQRRMVKYNSYAAESKLKSSLMSWFHWSKNK